MVGLKSKGCIWSRLPLLLFLHYTLVKADRWKISRLNYRGANHFNQALDVFHNELQQKSLKCQLALEGPGADGHAPFGLTQAAGLLKEQPGTCQQPGCLATPLIPSAGAMCVGWLCENEKNKTYIVFWEGDRYFFEIRKRSSDVWIIEVYVYVITNKPASLMWFFPPSTHFLLIGLILKRINKEHSLLKRGGTLFRSFLRGKNSSKLADVSP